MGNGFTEFAKVDCFDKINSELKKTLKQRFTQNVLLF